MTPEQESLRGRLAAHRRHHPDDLATETELRRQLKASRLEEYVQRTLATLPPLTADQRDRIALLLRDDAA
jgi:type II secretory pathway predicted ATPase ExeA